MWLWVIVSFYVGLLFGILVVAMLKAGGDE